uniref:Uncharacterized protein n=1 Tax=Caenorhabditis japonica TaxID=281687 RepID=A0A8R1ILP2_CAEJA
MVLQDFLIVPSVHPTSYKRQIEVEKAPQSIRDPPPKFLLEKTRRSLRRSCQYDLYPSGPSRLNFYSSEKVI